MIKNATSITALRPREGNCLLASWKSTPVDNIVGSNGPVNVLVIGSCELQWVCGVELAVGEGLLVRTAAKLADRFGASRDGSDGAFDAFV
jgi:hypothetical protein